MMLTYWHRALLSLLTAGLAVCTLATSSKSACAQLVATFPSYTTVIGSASYTTKIDSVWSKTCMEDAYCVFEPECSRDVSTAIGILRKTRTKFAVRSGGHMPNPGANSVSNGVLISLTRLNTLELMANHEVVHIGPGLRWFDVYTWMAAYNLTTAGGRFGPVGVGGLLLGGGINYYGSKLGWSTNNVINFEVVLADGRIVQANASSNKDLYWALKGGSQNFGIVTRYDMKTFAIQNVWGGTLAYSGTSLDAYIHAVANFSSPEGGSADPLAAADPLLLMYPNTSQIQPAAVLLYNAPIEQPAALKTFTDIPAASHSASLRTFTDFFVEQNSSSFWDRSNRRSFWATAVKATPEAVYLANTTFIQAAMEFIHGCVDLMLEGYQKTEGGLFYVPSPAGERLMIPTKYLDELKNADNEEIDFTTSFSEMFEGKYTTIGQKWHLHPNVVKKSLNANLELIMPDVYDEIVHAFRFLLTRSDDWQPVRMADIFTQIISRSSNRMLGGKALSRNRDWTDTSINFTTDTWLAAQQLKQYPAWLRPNMQHVLPEMGRVRRHFAVACQVICPIVQERSEAEQGPQNLNKPLDLLQMLWEGAELADRTPEFMAYTALAISFAAIRTSSSVPTHLLYDLCAQPEYIAPLREEIESVLCEEGVLFTKAALNKLVKLDSFMKESQRFNPLSLLTFSRVIQSDRILHDGIVIPKGTIIGVPAHAISQDAAFYPAPSTFLPFRLVPPSETPGGEKMATAGFLTTNALSSLSWGYGKHACSGRFFATHEIKLIMAHFLLHYDFRFAGGRTERPSNYTFELQNMPDETVEVLVRRR